ncbi:MAG: hypothetical protein PHF60_02890 [Candidatus ainarchaeum sp.]|nr:hypothetical protein [Candidatus ainarchaeum sp.]
MDRRYLEDLWGLFRKKYPGIYRFKEIDTKIIRMEKKPDFPVIGIGDGDITAYQGHSQRAAWIYKPWKDDGRWYAGFDYKGIAFKGNRIRRLGHTAWGGAYKERSLIEHRLSKRAFDGGVFCERPIAVYDYGRFNGKPLAVVVRAFTSPLRLSDVMLDDGCRVAYLGIRGETEREYCDSISAIVGENVRKLLDLGIYHGSMGMGNITSEGEIADFGPARDTAQEGVKETRDPFYRYTAILRVLKGGKNVFPRYEKKYNQNFADSFFGKRIELRTSNPAKEIAERYCSTKIDTGRVIGKKPDADIKKTIKLIKIVRKDAKTAIERKAYAQILKALANPNE